MASFFYTDKQKEMQQTYREAVREHILPHVEEIDQTDRIPKDLVGKLVKPPFSLTALSVPERFGGLEMDILSVCVIAEEIGYGCPAMIPFLEIAQLYTHVITLGGTEDQQERFLTRIAKGEIGCYALTDEGPGSDPASMKSTATKDGDHYLLNGKKRLITFADMSDLYAIFANENPSIGGKGVSAFIVEKGSPGMRLTDHCECMGLKGHRAYNMALEDLRVPAQNRIGETGEGLRLALRVLSKTRISLAFGFIGLARASLDACISFAKSRQVAGKPIATRQAIQFSLAELAARIDAARMLAFRVAVMADRVADHRRETSMAKFFAGDTLIMAVDLANRIHGGFGGMTEYPVERYLRDAYTWIAAQGTNEVQKLIVSREILK